MIEWKIRGVFKADAGQVFEEIKSIGGKVTPEEVVEKAEDPKTELHKCFEWDDQKAAHSWRCKQAQSIIQMLIVMPDEHDKAPTEPIRCMVSTGQRDNGYTVLNVAVRDEEQYSRMLQQAKEELAAFTRKYRLVAELKELIDEIEKWL